MVWPLINACSSTRWLSIILALWLYTHALFYFVPLIMPNPPILLYIWLLILDMLTIYITGNVSTKVYTFAIFYLALAVVNVLLVSYKYYVLVEAFSGLSIILPGLLVISAKIFKLKDFLKVWNKVAVVATFFSLVPIILVQYYYDELNAMGYVVYSVFAYLNLPNCIIFSYNVAYDKISENYRKISLLLGLINFFIILFWGGRMPAAVALITLVIGYMLSARWNLTKKISILALFSSVGVFAYSHIETVVRLLQWLLYILGIHSRNVALLLQLENDGSGMNMAGRDIIYSRVVEFIFERWGAPGGFGVALFLTDGKYYHPHNIFLQLAVLFGVIGALFFCAYVIYRLVQIRRYYSANEFKFTLLIFLDYFFTSLTGGSILTNTIAIMGMGMLFFYRKPLDEDDGGK